MNLIILCVLFLQFAFPGCRSDEDCKYCFCFVTMIFLHADVIQLFNDSTVLLTA